MSERLGNAAALPPVFFVSVASKRLSFSVSHLESTLTGMLISVVSKGLEGWRLRLKTGKTRCLSVNAHSKRLRSERREISGAWAVKELGDPFRQGRNLRSVRLPEMAGAGRTSGRLEIEIGPEKNSRGRRVP